MDGESLTNPGSHTALGPEPSAGYWAGGAASSWPPETPQSSGAAERKTEEACQSQHVWKNSDKTKKKKWIGRKERYFFYWPPAPWSPSDTRRTPPRSGWWTGAETGDHSSPAHNLDQTREPWLANHMISNAHLFMYMYIQVCPQWGLIFNGTFSGNVLI